MNYRTVILASVALVALGAGSAAAGPCTTEIDSLAKVMATRDAGAGPTSGAAGGAQTPAAPPAQQGTVGMARDPSEASNALNRARELDRQGNEAECMNAVQQAKQLAAPR